MSAHVPSTSSAARPPAPGRASVHPPDRTARQLTDPFSLALEWVPDENRLLVDAIRTWADEEVIPVRRRIDEDWDRHELCRPLLESLCVDHGYQWAAWPAAHGGGGMNAVASAMCLEEMSRADAGLATSASCSVWAVSPIAGPFENAALMELLAPRFLQTDRWYVGSAAISDGRGGSDVENLDGTRGRHIATTAALDGDEWVVNGHKLWPTNSGGAADLFAVFCTTDAAAGPDGLAIIYVPADTAGVTQGRPYKKAGMSGDWNSDVWFDNVRVPVEYRAHGPGTDALAARAFISGGNVGTAAQCIGVMRNVYELLREWCDTRVVGGKLLKEHTITGAVLADIVVSIETSRAETYLKARMLDRPDLYGPRHSPEMLARTRVTKLYVSDQLTAVVNRALDLMGSFGYARESDLEKHWRDSKILSLWMGGRALPQLDIARWFFDVDSY